MWASPALKSRRLFEDCLKHSERTSNARGWKISVSVLGQTARRTEYLQFDPFGRPTVIRPPNGADHDVQLAYAGVRRTIRSEKVKSLTGERYSSREMLTDRYGRLWRTVEPSGPGGSLATTTSFYDVGSRLVGVESGSQALMQERLFSYDNRGFLLAEQHPELGVSGNGAVRYGDYDAEGNVGRKGDGVHDLAYSYDAAGRLLSVFDRTSIFNIEN